MNGAAQRPRPDGVAAYHSAMPAIPHGIDALLFDMDGVLTDTARLHALTRELERLGAEAEAEHFAAA